MRLPGKVLMPLAGRPALEWLLERLDHATELDAIVVATSDDPSRRSRRPSSWANAARRSIAVRSKTSRRRMLDAAREHELDAVVRVTGDAPLLDQRLVDEGVRTLRREGCDLVSERPAAELPARPIG